MGKNSQPKGSLSKIKALDDTVDDDLEKMWAPDQVDEPSKLQKKIDQKNKAIQQKEARKNNIKGTRTLDKSSKVAAHPTQIKALENKNTNKKKSITGTKGTKKAASVLPEEILNKEEIGYNEEFDNTYNGENDEEEKVEGEELNEEFFDNEEAGEEGEEGEGEEEGDDEDLDLEDEGDEEDEDEYADLIGDDLVLDEEDDEMDEETRKKLKERNIQKAIEFRESQARKGVVYLSRIPPYMKVSQLRKLFSPYNVERIYLTPEDERKRKFRVKQGGNKRRSYTEGWMEFKDKKYAKYVAKVFNNQKIGGKRRSFYSEDVLNLKYLPKFKWENLTEKISYDMKMRKERLRTELSLEKKVHDFYRDQVETSKKIMGIKKHKELKRAALEDIDLVMGEVIKKGKEKQQQRNDVKTSYDDEKDKIRRSFPQKKPKTQ